MRLIIEPDYENVSRWAANYVAQRINEAAPTAEHPFVLGCPTGSSPLGMYKKLIELNTAGTNTLEAAATAIITNAASVMAEVAANTAANAADVEITLSSDVVMPGFYYSISAASSLTGTWTEGTRVLASGRSVTLPLPRQGTAGFYKVLVNLADKPTPSNP